MKLCEGKVYNGEVELHYLESQVDTSELSPLVIIPGLAEAVEDYIDIIKRIDNRKCIVISLRGRGKSDSPKSGYKLSEHWVDIFVNLPPLKKLILKSKKPLSKNLRF